MPDTERSIHIVNINGLKWGIPADEIRLIADNLTAAHVMAFVSSNSEYPKGSVANLIANNIGGPRFWSSNLDPESSKRETAHDFQKRVLLGFWENTKVADYQEGGALGFLVNQKVADALVTGVTGKNITIPEGAIVSLHPSDGQYAFGKLSSLSITGLKK